MDVTTTLSIFLGAIWLIGAVAYGRHVWKSEGTAGAVAEALIWPIAIIVKKGTNG